MSKARKVIKYSTAGALTTLYGLAIAKMLTSPVEPEPLSRTKAAVTAASLLTATWVATLL